MWEFLSEVLEKAGVVAALYVLTLIGIAVASRVVWRHIAGLNAKVLAAEKRATKAVEASAAAVERVRAEAVEARAAMRTAFDEERRRMDADCSAELLAVAEQRRAEAERYADRTEARGDRHSDQMVSLVEKSTRHIERIDQTVEKQTAVLDVLIRMGDGR